MEPEYEKYTLEELYFALENIDKDKFPERLIKIRTHIENYQNEAEKIKKAPALEAIKDYKLEARKIIFISFIVFCFASILLMVLGVVAFFLMPFVIAFTCIWAYSAISNLQCNTCGKPVGVAMDLLWNIIVPNYCNNCKRKL